MVTMPQNITQPSIPPGSVNEYQLQLGRQRQVWLFLLTDKCGVCRDPLRTRAGLARYISPIYIIDIYRIFSIFSIFIEFLQIFFNVIHCDYVLIFSLCVLLVYDLCPQHFLSVGQLLSDFTSPQQCSVNNTSTSPNMQCTHTHTIIW